ncbi:hypothetical protein ACWJJH_10260 [Endozoicomonadaceae bacterium StTr2]
MTTAVRYFYSFSGIHAFLIGLLPFFLPTLLWRQGYSLSEIAGFISISGLAYFVSLIGWEKLRSSNWKLWAVRGSFVTEALLVLMLVQAEATGLWLLAVANGVYGCFYWMSQRLLFKDLSSYRNSGNHFGNFQIVVTVLLKLGILAGAFLLEHSSQTLLAVLAVTASLLGLLHTWKKETKAEILSALKADRVSLKQALNLKDSNHSKLVFFVDGLFLFLESYFWTLSLYFLSSEKLMNLGGMVVGLAVALALLFWMVKRSIDRVDAIKLLRIATVLYAVSWWLRSGVASDTNLVLQLLLIMTIAFFTSLFRLSFNKVFFDRAEQAFTQQYLLAKSYYSQAGVFVFFGLLALFAIDSGSAMEQLNSVYIYASLLVPALWLYAMKTQSQQKEEYVGVVPS